MHVFKNVISDMDDLKDILVTISDTFFLLLFEKNMRPH